MDLQSNQAPEPKKVTVEVPERDLETIRRLSEIVKSTGSKELRSFLRGENPVKKPLGWSKHSRAPYYKEVYGLEAKAFFDKLMAKTNKEDEIIRYKANPNVKPATLYARFYQSTRYLIDFLDTPEHKYKDFILNLIVERERGVGIRISFPHAIEFSVDNPFATAELVVEKGYDWEDELNEYLEKGEVGKKKTIDKLALSPEQIADLKESFSQLKNLVYKVESDKIVLLKIPEKDIEKVKTDE